jgi:hypothetical protein
MITKITKSPWDFFLVIFVSFVIFVVAPWAVTSGSASPKSQRSGERGKTMAITFDDLPKSNGVEDIEGARRRPSLS